MNIIKWNQTAGGSTALAAEQIARAVENNNPQRPSLACMNQMMAATRVRNPRAKLTGEMEKFGLERVRVIIEINHGLQMRM